MSPDLETAALRALLDVAQANPSSAAALLEASGARPEDFADRARAALFALIVTCARDGKHADPVLFREKLAPVVAWKALAPYFFHDDLAFDPAERLRAVREAARRRRAAEGLGAVQSLLRSPARGLPEAIAQLSRTLEELRGGEVGSECTLDQDIVPFCDHLDRVDRGEIEPVTPTGIEALDAVIGGHESDILTFVGGLPAVGKGALLTAFARNLADRRVRCGLVWLEDPRRNLNARMVAEESGVPLFVLLKRRLTPAQKQRVAAAMERVYARGQYIDVNDQKAQTADQVEAACRRLATRGARVLIVSNLTRVDRPRTDRDDLEVQRVLVRLERVAADYHVAVLVDAHLKRRQGLDETKTAELSDFAFSAAIERCSKVALMVSRPNYGQPDLDNVLRVAVAKQMNGKAGVEVDLEFDGPSAIVRNRAAPETSAKANAMYAEDERA